MNAINQIENVFNKLIELQKLIKKEAALNKICKK